MKTRYNVLKYVFAAVFLTVAGMNVSAATKTVTYTSFQQNYNATNYTNNPSSNNITFTNCKFWEGIVGPKQGSTGEINFSSFYYKINSVTVKIKDWGNARGTITCTSCKNESSSRDVKNNSGSVEIATNINGIQSIKFKKTGGNNNIDIESITIIYEEPTITVTKNLEVLKKGNTVNIKNDGYFSVANQGDFTLNYSSSNTSVLTVDNSGNVTATGCDSAVITVSLVNGEDETVASTTLGTTQVFDIHIRESVASILKDKSVTISKGYQYWGGNYWIENEQGSFTCEYGVSDVSGSDVLELSGSTITGKNIGYGDIEVLVKSNGVEIGSASLSPDGGTAVYQLEELSSSSFHQGNGLSEKKESECTNGGFAYTSSNIISDGTPDSSTGWEFLGTLKSTAADGEYKVGYKSIDFTVEAPAYSSVAYQFSTTSVGSPNNNATFGSEILCTLASDNADLLLQTNTDDSKISKYSLVRVNKLASDAPGGSELTKKKASLPIIICDNQNGKASKNLQYRLDLMAWTGAQSGSIKAAFWYNTNPEITYYATVNFYSADGELLGSQDISAVGKTDRSHKLNAYTGTGKILGWKLGDTVGNVIAYTNGSPFNPYYAEEDCGYGPVNLIAIMDNSSSDSSSDKIGNTVSIHYDNGTLTPGKNYWIHNQVPLQLIVSTDSNVDAATGLPTQTLTSRYLTFDDDNENNLSVSADSYISVVLPRGYRILSYSLQSNSTDCTLKSKATNYTYSASALNGGISESFGNEHRHALYFELTNGDLSLDDFIITYTVEDAANSYAVNAIPSAGNSNISTDIMNLNSSADVRTAEQAQIKVYKSGTSTALNIENGYYSTSENTDYIVEAPAGYRIVGASLNFENNTNDQRNYNVYQTLSTISENDYNIVISDGLGHYLKVNGSTISSGDTEDDGARWIVADKDKLVLNNGKFLGNNNGTLALTGHDNALTYDSSLGTFVSGDYVLTYNYGWKLVSKYGPVRLYSGCFKENQQYKLSVTSGGTNYYMVDPGKDILPYKGSEGQGWLPVTSNKDAEDVIVWTYTNGHFVSKLSDEHTYFLSANIDWNDENYNILEDTSKKTPILSWEVDENGKMYQEVNDLVHPSALLKNSAGGANAAWGRRYLQYYDGNATVAYGKDLTIAADQQYVGEYAVDMSMSAGTSDTPLDFPALLFRKYTGTSTGIPPYYVQAYSKTGYGLVSAEPLEVKENATANTLSFEDDLNNDAIKFKVYRLESGYGDKATFRVNLNLLPLDPQVQTVMVTAKATGEYSKLTKSSDFKFNNGDDVVVVVPKGSTDTSYTLSLSDAANENDRSLDGASNFYLIGSSYYQLSQSANVNNITTFTRNATTTVGRNKIVGDELAAFETNKGSAELIDLSSNSVSLGDENTYYLYSADMPEYQISSTKHIAYRVYEMNVKVVKADADPIIKLETIYNSLSNDNAVDDANHNYVGVTVGARSSILNLTSSGYYYICEVKNDKTLYMVRIKGNEQTLNATENINDDDVAIWYVDKLSDRQITISTPIDNVTYYLARISGQSTLCLTSVKSDDIYWNIDETGHVIYGSYVLNFENEKWQASDGGIEHSGPINAASYSNATSGYFTSEDVIKAVTSKLEGTVGYSSSDKILYVDMSGLASVAESETTAWSSFQSSAADNALFFMPSDYADGTFTKNVIRKNGDSYVSACNLVITDKKPFYSPYEFSTGSYTASYEHITGSKWGTMCVPFDVKNNTETQQNVKYYNLVGSSSTKMAFSMSTDATILANTPVVCKADGNFTCTSQNVTIAKDTKEEDKNNIEFTNSVSVGTYNATSNEVSTGSDYSWNLIGARYYKFIYGNENSNVYCFSNNRMYAIDPTSYVSVMPLRAYYDLQNGAMAKSMSFVVLDEDGFETDITDIINGEENAGDGKIYDLLGRRVKTPVKGSIYIVNGKKKVY